jgi:biotin synthase-like enzyme
VLSRYFNKNCVYCGIKLLESTTRDGSRKQVATWEHIINDARIMTRNNITRCCAGRNSSKGTKLLADWMQSDYRKKKGISKHSVADVVRKALRNS